MEDGIVFMIFGQFLTAAIYGLAGFFLFFVIFDRVILQMWESFVKTFTVYSTMSLFLLGSPILGWIIGWNNWIWFPIGILIILTAGEAFRYYLIAKYRQFQPQMESSIKIGAGRFFTTRSLILRRHVLPLKNWKGKPLRIVHMTDLHVNGKPPISFYEECISEVNKLNPDLIVLTGDYVNKNRFIPDLKRLFSRLQARYGVYGILGNHEYYVGSQETRQVMREAGVELIHGQCCEIATADGNTFSLCGHEYPWGKSAQINRQPNLSKPVIVLTHTPDNVYSDDLAGSDVVFAGHLHGGQWRLPLVGSLVVPSHHGRLLDQGYFKINKLHLFVSAGIGLVWFPCRIRCYPEILAVDLVPVVTEPVFGEKTVEMDQIKAAVSLSECG